MPSNTPEPARYLIDTSSLSSSISYYADLYPHFKLWIKKQFVEGPWVLLRPVFSECWGGKPSIIDEYSFLKNDITKLNSKLKKLPECYEWIDTYCADEKVRETLSGPEYESKRETEFKRHADLHLIFTAMKSKGSLGIISEETRAWNGKLFKKIPVICDHEDINVKCITLPQFMKQQGLEIRFPNLLP